MYIKLYNELSEIRESLQHTGSSFDGIKIYTFKLLQLLTSLTRFDNALNETGNEKVFTVALHEI